MSPTVTDPLEAIREGIRANLDAIDGLAAFAYIPDTLVPPCIYPYPAGTDFDTSMGRGADWQTWTLEAFVNMASGKAAQVMLDGFIAGSGPLSVKEALEVYDAPGRVTLGGACSDLRVVRCTGYTTYTLMSSRQAGGGSEALGCQWTVEILAGG